MRPNNKKTRLRGTSKREKKTLRALMLTVHRSEHFILRQTDIGQSKGQGKNTPVSATDR